LLDNNGVLRDSRVVKMIPEQSVVGLHVGDPISLTEEEIERLSAAFFAEIERKVSVDLCPQIFVRRGQRMDQTT
jgi:hypothetical protein